MSDINEPIVKEKSIVQGCQTGNHNLDRQNIGIKTIDGSMVMLYRCIGCGTEVALPTKELGDLIPEKKEASTPEARELPSSAPAWAPDVVDRYHADKSSDDFWGSIKDKVKND